MAVIPLNMANVQPAEKWRPVAGDYYLEIVSATQKAAKETGNPYLEIVSKVLMGPGAAQDSNGRKVYHNYMLSDKGAPFLRRLIDAAGLGQHVAANGGQFDDAWLVGRQILVKLTMRNDSVNVGDERPIQAAGQPQAAPMNAPATAPSPSMLQPVVPAVTPAPAQPQFAQPQFAAPAMPQGFVPAPQAAQPMAPQGFAAPAPPPGFVGQR